MRRIARKYRKIKPLVILAVVVLIAITNTAPGYLIRGSVLTIAGDIRILLTSKNDYLIDDTLMDAYVQDGGTIVYDSLDDIRSRTRNTTYAYYSMKKKEIHIPRKSKAGHFEHEFGHYLDQKYEVSDSEEFKNLISNNKEALHWAQILITGIDYGRDSLEETGNMREYFANVYSFYIAYTETLKSLAPQVYEYIDNFEKEITHDEQNI